MRTNQENIVIIGAGFAGLRLARRLAKHPVNITLIDRYNFHQFQPLFYQVATAGLAPSAIAFPIRKVFHGMPNVHVRMAEVLSVDLAAKKIQTDIGDVPYDRLIVAMGADTNYFKNRQIEQNAFPMKSVQESLHLRNRILECMEQALTAKTKEELLALLNIVVVGGGPTGTEISGALAEMRSYVLPKDYPELDFKEMQIHLIEAAPRLLASMSEASSRKSADFLRSMGVEVKVNTMVSSFDGNIVEMSDGERITAKTLIWAAGIKGNHLSGIPSEWVLGNGRIKVNQFNQTPDPNVFALGDIAQVMTAESDKGHPQVAQVAIQQADRLAGNFERIWKNKPLIPFKYKDLGSMATIGRNKAVVDLPFIKFQGFIAWVFWLFVHLMAILGVKNKLMIFVEWFWNYLTFDQSLRLVIKQKPRHSEASEN